MTSFLKNLKEELDTVGNLKIPPLNYVLQSNLVGDGLIIDLGTGKGKDANLMASTFDSRQIHSFDWFNGLPENWRQGYNKGTYSLDGIVPSNLASNVVVHKGLFRDTLPKFAQEYQGQSAALIQIDCNVYSSTSVAFRHLAGLIKIGTIIVFDAFLNYSTCEKHGVKAFEEFLIQNDLGYKAIGMRGSPYFYDKTNKTDERVQKAALVIVESSAGGVVPRLNNVSRSVSRNLSHRSPRLNEEYGSQPASPKGVFKVKLVVAYGRRKVAQNLLIYIRRELNCFDQVIFWENTANPEDINFLKEYLREVNDPRMITISPVKVTGDHKGVGPLYRSIYEMNKDENVLWIKIDDDVVWVENGAFERLIDYAYKKRYDHTVFSANVVNSGPMDAVHQRAGASKQDLIFTDKKPFETLFDYYGANQVHKSLLDAIGYESTHKYYVDHSYLQKERWALSCIAWWSKTFDQKDIKELVKNDTKYITQRLGDIKTKYPVVVPDALMCHYSFTDQLKTTKSKRPGEKGKKVKHVGGFDPECKLLNMYVNLSRKTLKEMIPSS